MKSLTVDLPDGSLAVCEPVDHRTTLVCRSVDNRTVWGQVFSTWPEDHPAQVESVLADMRRNPAAYKRWWHTEGEGE